MSIHEIEEQDERGNCPSSSGAEALMLCNGKWRMEQTCGIPEDRSKDADRGEGVHAAIESGDGRGLKSDALRDAKKLAAEEKTAVEDWLAEIGEESIKATYREERLWLENMNGDQIFSGKPDAVHVAGKHLLVVDYKSGWNPYPVAEKNVQLACNAVLASRRFGITKVRVALIQARFGTSVADHDAKSLRKTKKAIITMSSAIASGHAQLVAGDKQCRFCRAYAVCPAVKSRAIAVMTNRSLSIVPTGDELRAYAAIDKLMDERRRLATLAMQSGIPIEGWELGKGRKSYKITDPTEAFARCQPVLAPERFAECCTVSLPKLSEAWAETTKLPLHSARKNIEELLSGVLSITTGAESLKQSKEEPQ